MFSHITVGARDLERADRKSTRLNSSHANISYAVFCLKKKRKDLTARPFMNIPPILACPAKSEIPVEGDRTLSSGRRAHRRRRTTRSTSPRVRPHSDPG